MPQTAAEGTVPGAGTTPGSPSSVNARGCGCRECLFGCLGVMIALSIVFAVGGWFGYTRYLRPWFLGMRERVYETVPQLEALEQTILGDGDLSGFERNLSGSADPAAFPQDVALPDDPEILTTRSNDLRALAVVETRGRTAVAIVGALRAEMRSLGWSRIPAPDPDDGIALRFERDGDAGPRVAAYELVPRENGRVRVWVRVTRGERTPRRAEPR